jgi:uncharacterized repeat protein (TIGR01451 family)
MFRKLVSSLPFSPALVGQLGFYARRLSKEQATRRLGLIFTALALVVQSFALFSPPEQSYAASPSNECQYNSALTKNDTDCKPCPSNDSLWIKDSGCNANISLTTDATNLSQSSKAATKTTAAPGDRIQYNLHTTNTSNNHMNVVIEQDVGDLLEYATVIDAGGGVFDVATKKVTWGIVSLNSKQTDVRSFVIQLNDSIAVTPQAADNSSSYDCILTNTYGNTLRIAIDCPLGKEIESTIKQLPETGIGANIFFSLVVVMTVTYFYARSRQMNREMKVIRRDFNVG